MYLRYHAGRTFRHVGTALAEGALIITIAAALVFGVAVVGGSAPAGAGDVNAGGKLTATISFGYGLRATSVSSGSGVSFAMTRSVPDNDPVMWVTQKCYDSAGNLVSWYDRAVEWGAASSLTGKAGPYTASGDHCTAYATLKPWRSTVLGDAKIDFPVGG